MATLVILVAASLTWFLEPTAQLPIRINNTYPDSQIYQDYSTATNGELIDAAARKVVTLDKGSQCSFDSKNIISAGSLKEGDIIPGSNSSDAARLLLTCKTDVCVHSFNPESFSPVTPQDRRSKLEDSDNAVITSLSSFTYLLTFAGRR